MPVKIKANKCLGQVYALLVVKIGPAPCAGLDKDPYPCCSAVDHKFTHSVVAEATVADTAAIMEKGITADTTAEEVTIVRTMAVDTTLTDTVAFGFPVTGRKPVMTGGAELSGCPVTIDKLSYHLLNPTPSFL